MTEGIIVSAAALIVGFLLGRFIGNLIFRLFVFLKGETEEANNPKIVEYSSLRACDGPHSWEPVYFDSNKVAKGTHDVCLICGTISGNDDWMLSDSMLGQLANLKKKNDEIIQQQEKAAQDFINRVRSVATAELNLMIKNSVDPETFEQYRDLFSGLAQSAIDCLKHAGEKVQAERDAQEELNNRYKNWIVKAPNTVQ